MAGRKPAMDPASMLARLTGAARPTSETWGEPDVDRPAHALDTATIVPPAPMPPGTPDTDSVVPCTQELLSARVRGRWTQDQLKLIKSMARRHHTTAGDVIRHITAWYCEEGHVIAPPASEQTGPSAIGLQGRVSLTTLDFLTTPTQRNLLAGMAARYRVKEAAILRHAVDAYAARGPLAHKQQ